MPDTPYIFYLAIIDFRADNVYGKISSFCRMMELFLPASPRKSAPVLALPVAVEGGVYYGRHPLYIQSPAQKLID